MRAIERFLRDRRGMVAVGIVAALAMTTLLTCTAGDSDGGKQAPPRPEKAAGGTAAGTDPVSRDESSIVTGSGERFQTTVDRKTQGELSAKDLHQVSLLASRVVKHLNDAVKCLLDEDAELAKPEIESACTLVGVIRDLLPVTTVTTVVRDAAGKEVYRDVDRVQDDIIPLYRGMIAREVVEPIIAAKEEAAALKGLRLAEADLIFTSVLLDLAYVERKLNRAGALLDKPKDALEHLLLAQASGIDLVVNKKDDPLVQAQYALRLAERMVEEGKHEAAKENLKIAQVQLGLYRALLDKDSQDATKQLEDEIAALMAKTLANDAAAKIRGFWERVADLFKKEPGQAHVVDKSDSKSEAREDK